MGDIKQLLMGYGGIQELGGMVLVLLRMNILRCWDLGSTARRYIISSLVFHPSCERIVVELSWLVSLRYCLSFLIPS